MPTAVKQSKNRSDDDLPPLPKPDKNGNFPAVEYARVSLARDIIRDRRGRADAR